MLALERMQLNKASISYFGKDYHIRLLELGANHHHTITSRLQRRSVMAHSRHCHLSNYVQWWHITGVWMILDGLDQ